MHMFVDSQLLFVLGVGVVIDLFSNIIIRENKMI